MCAQAGKGGKSHRRTGGGKAADAQGREGLAPPLQTANAIARRPEVEQALRESEQKYRELAENINDGVYVLDTKGRFEFVNAVIERRSGMALEQWRGRNFLDIITPSQRAQARGNFRRSLKGEAVGAYELSYTSAHGHLLTIELNHRPILRDGKVVGVMGISRDVTERKQAIDEIHRLNEELEQRVERRTAQLHKAEERLRNLIDNTWDIIFRIDLKGRFTFGNKAAERITGYPLRKLMKMNMADLLAPEYREAIQDRLRQRIAGQPMPQPFTYQIVSRQGRRVWLEVTTRPMLDEEGAMVGVQGIARNITGRMQAEQAWRESEARYRQLLDHLPVGIYRTAIKSPGVIVMANTAAAKLFGYATVEEYVGTTAEQCYVDPGDRAAVMRELVRNGQVVGKELRLKRKDGIHFWARTDARLVKDSTGRPRWLDGHMQDITAQKTAEEALQSAQRRIVTAGEMERRRLARELHDSMGQQLVAARLSLQRAEGECKRGQMDEAHRLMARATEALGHAIQETRAICYGLFPPALESLGLCAALAQLARVSGTKMRVRVKCSPGLARTRFEPQVEIALYRIAQEAVSNALRHSEGARVDIRCAWRGGRLRLAIADDGRGFANGQENNHGLGLGTMRERATAIGGSIGFRSSAKGTQIRAEVPAQPLK